MALYAGIGADPLERLYLNQNPDAGFWRYLMSRGWGGTDPLSEYARRQQSRAYGQYSAFAAQNPDQGFFDYLEQNKPDFYSDFANQAPSQRGDIGSTRYAPRVRYVRPY
jgi:hypothetical protein